MTTTYVRSTRRTRAYSHEGLPIGPRMGFCPGQKYPVLGRGPVHRPGMRPWRVTCTPTSRQGYGPRGYSCTEYHSVRKYSSSSIPDGPRAWELHAMTYHYILDTLLGDRVLYCIHTSTLDIVLGTWLPTGYLVGCPTRHSITYHDTPPDSRQPACTSQPAYGRRMPSPRPGPSPSVKLPRRNGK